MITTHYFTFGSDHMSNHPDLKGRLADHWVRVRTERGWHRHAFIELFARLYLPHKRQWAMEYFEKDFNPEYFPAGELCFIEYDYTKGPIDAPAKKER